MAPSFNPEPYEVIKKMGNSTVIQSPDGRTYGRNTQHLKKLVPPVVVDESPNVTQPIVQAPECNTPIVEYPRPQIVEAEPELVPDPGIVTVAASPIGAPKTFTPSRPQRDRRPPPKFKDYVMK